MSHYLSLVPEPLHSHRLCFKGAMFLCVIQQHNACLALLYKDKCRPNIVCAPLDVTKTKWQVWLCAPYCDKLVACMVPCMVPCT
jgi:hypothetical protein